MSLVGAGPGDPGLLTLRGKAAIERADVVLYDYLASSALLSALPVIGQERIHVGKRAGAGHSQQLDINALMVKRALLGQRVVRLKGGDPFVFGRGGEEAQACVAAGVPFEIVPGVTSAIGAPAYAGIPVTHREVASCVTFVTGHEREAADGSSADSAASDERVDWHALAQLRSTLVVLMGVQRVARWSKALIAGGRAADTPVAFIRWGTTPRQHVLTTTLEEATAAVHASGLAPPAVAVIGKVVELADSLEWFSGRPLFGHVVALTRAAKGGDDSAAERLRQAGAVVIRLPLTQQEDRGEERLDACFRALSATDLVFTSANGVRAVRRSLERCSLDARSLHGVRTWAVGPATAGAMRRELGLAADIVAAVATGEGLVAEAKRVGVSGARFLFPAAEQARRVVPEGLAALGASVDEVAAYATVPTTSAVSRLLTAQEEGLSLITLASPSATSALVTALGAAGLALDTWPVAAIGPTTAAAAVAAGLKVSVIAKPYSMVGLADAIIGAAEDGAI